MNTTQENALPGSETWLQQGYRLSLLLEECGNQQAGYVELASIAQADYDAALFVAREQAIDHFEKLGRKYFADDVKLYAQTLVREKYIDLQVKSAEAEQNEVMQRNLRQQISFAQSALKVVREDYEAVMSGQSGG